MCLTVLKNIVVSIRITFGIRISQVIIYLFGYFKSFQASSMCMALMPSFSDGVMSCSMLSPIDKITSGFRPSFLAPPG